MITCLANTLKIGKQAIVMSYWLNSKVSLNKQMMGKLLTRNKTVWSVLKFKQNLLNGQTELTIECNSFFYKQSTSMLSRKYCTGILDCPVFSILDFSLKIVRSGALILQTKLLSVFEISSTRKAG